MSLTLEQIKTYFFKDQLPETFGLDITSATKESVTGTLTVDARHLRPGRIMNGGVSLVLIETIGSVSSSMHIDVSKQNTFGMQINANHLAVARPGDFLTAKSRIVHIGRSTQVWDVDITNQEGKKVSSGRITMMVTEL
jgi:1,4-dihydroxy-2-naphthoyl-CoA hydrolase